MSKLIAYETSTGSGKTFILTTEYIELLIQNPRAYRQILAVAFTSKATAGMKEHILSQLYGVHVVDPDSDAYLKRIITETGRSEDGIRKTAGIALSYMLHDYNRFRVKTVDSFFQSVTCNLAHELRPSPNLNIELNNIEILNDAVDSTIEKLGPSSPVLAWLFDYINGRIANDKRRNVSGRAKNFGRNIFDEGYVEKDDSLRQYPHDPGIIRECRKALKEMETATLE